MPLSIFIREYKNDIVRHIRTKNKHYTYPSYEEIVQFIRNDYHLYMMAKNAGVNV